MKPLTIGITLATWQDSHILLRMMLNSLSQQTVKDFDIIIVDHFYENRIEAVKELAEHYKLDILHMPFIPATHYAKRYMDMSVFQTAFVMSESERVCRLSEYRFVSPEFVERILATPGNLDFFYHDLAGASFDVWDEESDFINWRKVPFFPQTQVIDEPYPLNAYGNYCHVREQWLAINGFQDNLGPFHWEDQDFNARASKVGQRSSRLPNLMFRIYHTYPSNQQRATRPLLHPFKDVCGKCQQTVDRFYAEWKPGYNDSHWSKYFMYRDRSEISYEEQQGFLWLQCNECKFTLPILENGDVQGILLGMPDYKQSPIGLFGNVGRNMRTLSEDLRGKSWSDKIVIHEDSWTNPKYYQQ